MRRREQFIEPERGDTALEEYRQDNEVSDVEQHVAFEQPAALSSAEEQAASNLIEQEPASEPNTEALKRRIDAAATLDELKQAIAQATVLQSGSGHYASAEVNERITNAERFLDKYIMEIVTGVITGGEQQLRTLLGEKLYQIPRGGSLGIREKARGLFKEQMRIYFELYRKELVTTAISEAKSFEELYYIIRQFRKVNIEKEYGEFYSPDEAVQIIMQVHHDWQLILQDNKFLSSSQALVDRNIAQLLEKVPHDSGIRRKVEELLYQMWRNKLWQLRTHQSKQHLGQRLLGRLGNFFRRR